MLPPAIRRHPVQGAVGATLGEGVRGPFFRVLGAFEAEQDRWVLWVPVLFGAGITVYFNVPQEPPLLVAVAPLIATLAIRAVWQRHWILLLLTSAACAVALGLAAAKLRADWVAAPVLERQMGPVEVHGWIELVEPRPERGQRVTLRVAAIKGLAPEELPYRVRVSVAAANAALKPGDAVIVRANLSPPAGPALPGGYDFARSAWFQGLGGVGHAVAPVRLDGEAGEAPLSLRVRAAIERLRQRIGTRIAASLPGERGFIANALITGERGGISDATNAAYRDSGLLHILSISGLHMVIMAGAVFVTVRFLLALVPALALRFPIKKWAAAAAAMGALAYLLISGASFPTVRSYIMISIMFLAVLLDRPALALRNVAVAALAILVVFPESLIDVGFQMSFAAVVALVSAYEIVRERARAREGGRSVILHVLLFFGGIVLSTLIASFAVAPFAAYHFHKSQQYAVLANLIAIPICNIVVMPAALATLLALPFGLEWVPLQIMGAGIEGMTWCAYRVAALPGAVGAIAAIPAAAFALMVFGGIWLALWRTRLRLLGVVPLAVGLALATQRHAPDVLVGRGGALVAVRTAEGLSAIAGRGASFELARWLEHDGDRRKPEDAADGRAFRCDDSGCAAIVGSRVISLARHASALRDDCARAALLVTTMPAVAPCKGPAVVVGPERLRRLGAHAVYLRGEGIEIETVADRRGDRPWTAPSPAAEAYAHRPAVGGKAAPDDRRGRSYRAAPGAAPRRTRSPTAEDEP
jgi:competence protein ComEC